MFSDRLKKARKEKKLTQEQLAALISVERSSVGKYESANVIPSPEVLRRIADALDVSVDYLMGREGAVRGQIRNVVPVRTKKVPLLGDIACGKPIFAEETYGEVIDVSAEIDCDFCLRCVGDSMTGARIRDGDLVFCREQPTVENGEIAAVIIENEATLKRVYYYPEKNKLVLNPENPAFEPLVYVGAELDQIQIIGKAVAFQSMIR